MNIPIPSTAYAMTDFVFRSADRMRIDGCANAVAREGLSLALFCEHEALLDHYLGSLLTQLRQQAPEHSIEVYFPANTDSLLARFNEALARQSVEQATRSSAPMARAQIWIVHDAHTLPETEIQLLARLIQNFPGAHIRAILLMSGPLRQNINLTSFGRKLLRWDIETPNPEQVQAAMEMARSEGRSGPLVQMLKRMDPPDLSATLDANTLLLQTATEKDAQAHTPTTFKHKILGWHQHGQERLQRLGELAKSGHPRAWTRHPKSLALAVVASLSVSTLIMLWLQPQSFGLAKPYAQMEKSPETTAPSTPNAPIAQAPLILASSPSPAAAEPNAQLANTSKDSRPNQTWIKGLDPESFLLQYGTEKAYDKALSILKSLPDIKNTAIVEAYNPGESVAHFVIVSGPYAQVNDGYVASRQAGIPNGSWVRSTRSLQNQIQNSLSIQGTSR
jgi:hypothetical protein